MVKPFVAAVGDKVHASRTESLTGSASGRAQQALLAKQLMKERIKAARLVEDDATDHPHHRGGQGAGGSHSPSHSADLLLRLELDGPGGKGTGGAQATSSGEQGGSSHDSARPEGRALRGPASVRVFSFHELREATNK